MTGTVQTSQDPNLATSVDKERHLASIGWAMSHHPTREAYRRCTGEDVGPALDRYRAWLDENITGGEI